MGAILPRREMSSSDILVVNTIPEDSLVAIFRQIDCGSLFKTVRLVSRIWRKLADRAHPTGDEKFADTITTIYFLKNNLHVQVLDWYFHHNIEINKNITERILGEDSADFTTSYYFTKMSDTNPEFIAMKGDLFLRSLVWVDGVIRLTDESVAIILASDYQFWDFVSIYKHAKIPFSTTQLFYKKFTLGRVDLYKYHGAYYREELRNLGHFYGWAQSASREEIIAAARAGPDDNWTQHQIFKLYENPNLTWDIILAYPNVFKPYWFRGITFQIIDDHPEMDWNQNFLFSIKFTDENIERILNVIFDDEKPRLSPCDRTLNHHLITTNCIHLNPSCTWKYAKMIANVFGKEANQILQTHVLRNKKPLQDGFIDLLPPDWDGHLKSLSWKFLMENCDKLGSYIIGQMKSLSNTQS